MQSRSSLARHGLALVVACVAMLTATATAAADTGDPLNYFGGPVAHSMTGVIVGWGSSINSAYTNASTGDPGLIKYLAGASGSTGGIGGVMAQYMDSTRQNAANRVTYSGDYQITPSVTGSSLTDGQVQQELVNQIGTGHLPTPTGNGLSTIYLVLFPSGDTICLPDGTCSGSQFCAYHASTQLADGTHVLYAVLPDNTSGPMSQGCGSAPTFLQDQTSYLSHEWSETITDPLVADATSYGPPLAWYDAVCPTQTSACGEVGDKCNQQTAGEGSWTVQTEWSNLDSGCEVGEPKYAPPTAAFTPPAGPLIGQQLSFDGSGSSDPSQDHTSASYSGTTYSIGSGIASYGWNWGDGSSGSGTTATHTYAQAGTYQVSLTVTDNLGFTSTVTRSISVAATPGSPAATTGSASAISSAGATLGGSVNPAGQSISYQFLYGTSPGALDQSTPLTPGPTGTSSIPVSASLTSLQPSTTYYFELNVISGGQTYPGDVQQFATPSTGSQGQVPVPGTGSASAVAGGSAQLTGTLNPGGSQAVGYWFAYGTSPDSLDHISGSGAVPAGTTAAPVSRTIGGLTPGTIYYFRLFASLGGQTFAGSVKSFSTPLPRPSVLTGAFRNVSSDRATVLGTVTPFGRATAYHVEYGRSIAYGYSTRSTSAGSGLSAVAVSATLLGLRPNTVYHYRLVASNAGGTTVGQDLTLRTAPPPAPAPRFKLSAAAAQSLAAALRRGLSVGVSCSRACTARLTVYYALPGLTRLLATPLALGTTVVHLRAGGRRTMTVGLLAGIRRRLSAVRSVRLVVAGYATSGGSPSRPEFTTIVLRR